MNDDTLILYYYGDGLSEDERAAVECALGNDASLRERYRELRLSLDRFSEPPAIGAPAQAVARWHRSIERAAAQSGDGRSSGRGWHFPSFAWGALAAALVAAAGIGLYFGEGSPPVTTIADGTVAPRVNDRSPVQPTATPVSFSRGLQVHLRQSRQDIMRLAEDGQTPRAMLIMDIQRQNRMFEQAAREHGAEDIARVLRAIEPVLSRLAREDLSEQDAAALQAKLAFELNVMLTKMQQRESQDTETI
ncbi:MAG TPA: hypothetical protein VHG33_05130 [Woeseiaceae bacterium]|nr:hypothetical protein [Woeseiaceae bacterium]